jgi:hypothetical protein
MDGQWALGDMRLELSGRKSLRFRCIIELRLSLEHWYS